MKFKKLMLIALLQALSLPVAVNAADVSSPTILMGYTEGYIRRISDNGLWGVVEKSGTVEGSIAPGGGVIIDLSNASQKDISHSSGLSGVADITDDGTIVVGEFQNVPGYYSTADKKWHSLPLPSGAFAGRLEAVTPDGHYAAGYVISKATGLGQYFDNYGPVMYDLTSGEIVDLPNMPVLDMQHENMHMTMISDISPDGRYLVGRVSQSYIQPPGIFSYVYDRENASYTPIGFTENTTSAWTPTIQYTHFCDFPFLSPDGRWIVGTAYMVEPMQGSEWPKEYKAVYRYDISTGEYICYNNGAAEQNIDGVSVLSDGTVTAATPSDNPYADALVRSGDYFVTFDQVLRQNYGISFAEKTGWDNTGKLICSSADGKTLISLVGPRDCYIIHLPETLSELAANVDLMAGYTISPEPGTTMSKLKTFNIKFDREITVQKSAGNISFKSADGSESYTALTATVNETSSTTLTVTFRTRDLSNGTDYTLSIPEGMVCLKGDKRYQNKLITASYKGHDNSPMRLTSAYPAEGAEVGFIDYSNNPINLTFDVNLAYGETSAAYIYRENETTPYCSLNFAIGENRLMLYPSARVNLFNGTNYRMVVEAGSLTDLTGGCANEEIVLNWSGSYVREWSKDDTYLFKEECDSYENFMFFDGDCNVPGTVASEWGFTQYVPWYIVRDSNESSDMSFASHSMYTPAGQSDDWCVIPQIFIPDENCYLQFDAQSYMKDKADFLTIYAYEDETVYNTLSNVFVNDIRMDGDQLFHEQLSPGATEEGLADEWTHYVVSLEKYAGKPIYIAFVNQNKAQSAIFIDNVQVIHDMHYLVTIESPSRVVDYDEIEIAGNITVASDVDNFSTARLTLSDASGTVVSEISESGLNFKKGDSYSFSFPDALPLVKGVANKYQIAIALDDIESKVNGEVKNLLFEPVKKIVIEEYSGRDCGNCPLGFLAMDKIKELYPGKLLPVVIRTYNGDPHGNSVTAYSSYLGMENVGAPSGRVNRSEIMAPMVQIDGDYMFSGVSAGEQVWLDKFVEEVAQPAEAEINFSSTYDAASNTATVTTTVRNAISANGTNINIFAVVTENNLDAGYQSNYYSNVPDPDLGIWGQGGAYGKSYVIPFTVSEVARTTWGNTFQGTGGLIPANVEGGLEYENTFEIALPSVIENPANCEVTVMLIDALKGNIINANRCEMVNGKTADSSGVTDITTGGSDIVIYTAGSSVVANGASTLTVYATDGRILGIASEANGAASVALDGYRGIAIAVAADANGNTATAKLAVR